MTRSLLVPVVTLVVLGCSEGPAAPRSIQAAKPAGPSFAAIVQTSNESVPTDIVVLVPCANGGSGELVELTGNLHVLSTVTTSGSGNMTIRTLFQPQGISGTGLTTGTKYQATGGTQETLTVNGAFPFVDTFVNNFRIIGAGTGNNLIVHTTGHITVDANGVVRAVVDNTTIDCK